MIKFYATPFILTKVSTDPCEHATQSYCNAQNLNRIETYAILYADIIYLARRGQKYAAIIGFALIV